MLSKRSKLAAASATAATALLMAAGLAGAVDLPSLPSQADPSVADEKLAELEVPPADPAGTHDDGRQDDEAHAAHQSGADTQADDEDEELEGQGEGEGERPTDTHGYEVSQLATSTEGGEGKGEAISTLAKTWGTEQREAHAQNDGDHGQAGEHGQGDPQND